MEALPKGTVIARAKCAGCGSDRPLTITKTGKTCYICGVCNTRVFYGGEPSNAQIERYMAGRKKAPAPEQQGGADERPANFLGL